MNNIKIILFLSLAAYATCGSGKKKSSSRKIWDDDDSYFSEPSSLSEDSDVEVYIPKNHGKSKSKIPTKSPKQKPTSGNVQGHGVGGNFSNFGNFGNRGASSNYLEKGNLIGNPNINLERTADGFKINGRIVPRVHPYNAIEIDWSPQGGIAVNGEKKTGFEDIKYSGRTLLGPVSNPVYADGAGTGVEKQGLGVEFTDDGVLVNGQRTQKYDVGDQRVNVDMTGNGFKVNGVEVKDPSVAMTGPRQWAAPDRKSHKKTRYPVRGGNNGGLVNSNNVNSNNVNWNNRWEKNYTRRDFDAGGSSRYNTTNRGKKDVQYNNFGNKGQQFNHEGNRGTQYNNSGNIGHAVYNQGNITVEFKGDALSINGTKVPEVNAKDVKMIKWGKGSLMINGIKNERFNGIRGAGTMNF